jgi:IS4 transposase
MHPGRCRFELTGFYTRQKYPDKLRWVRAYDERNQKEIVILTNNISWTTTTISQLYNARWDIETFFQAIKQTLRIKAFVGQG